MINATSLLIVHFQREVREVKGVNRSCLIRQDPKHNAQENHVVALRFTLQPVGLT